MYFETDKWDHGLPHNPFKSCVVPRPIGWISTVSRAGIVNLAPFSQFIALSYDPPFVAFSASHRPDNEMPKDSATNAMETGEFVYNMATYDLRNEVAKTSEHVPADVDEFEYAGLEKAPSRLVKPPRVARSPINFECRFHSTLVLPSGAHTKAHMLVIGEVLAVHIHDEVIANGRVDILKVRPLARMGYLDYTSVTDIFQITGAEARPGLIGDIVKKPAAE